MSFAMSASASQNKEEEKEEKHEDDGNKFIPGEMVRSPLTFTFDSKQSSVILRTPKAALARALLRPLFGLSSEALCFSASHFADPHLCAIENNQNHTVLCRSLGSLNSLMHACFGAWCCSSQLCCLEGYPRKRA